MDIESGQFGLEAEAPREPWTYPLSPEETTWYWALVRSFHDAEHGKDPEEREAKLAEVREEIERLQMSPMIFQELVEREAMGVLAWRGGPDYATFDRLVRVFGLSGDEVERIGRRAADDLETQGEGGRAREVAERLHLSDSRE
ncbi:MAG: hypothetical protein V1826_00520 [bacterium]